MDSTLKLPHPVRVGCNDFMVANTKEQDQMFDHLTAGLELEKCSIDHLLSVCLSRAPDLYQHLLSQGMTRHNIWLDLSSKLIPYKFRKLNGNILTTSDVIEEKLEVTDIGNDIPISYLRPPFKNCYIEFTESRTSSLIVYNEISGEHILEGVYLSEVEILPDTEAMDLYIKTKEFPYKLDSSKPLRVLDMMFTGSPIGKSNVGDDALRMQGFYVQDDDLTVNEQLRFIENTYGKDEDFADDLNYLSSTLKHMAKVLLFVNCKQYRDTAFNERQEMEKQVSSIKSPAKLRKFNKKLRKSYNRLIIKPEDHVVYKSDDKNKHSDNHEPKKAHWRKGHFRMQPYGAGASRRKVIYIEPTIVGGLFADKKSYNVREK